MTSSTSADGIFQGPGVVLRAAGASDRGGADAMLELPGATGACLVAVPRGGSVAEARARLEDVLAEEVRSASHLRLLLMRALREIEPRPLGLAAALVRPGEVLVAATPGASVSLVRGERVEEHVTDAASLGARAGDRLALLCCRLDPLLRDADELGRLVAADDPRGSVVTLVEVGHLRGGTELSAVVAELASPGSEPSPGDEEVSVAGMEDLLRSLAPALDAFRRTPTPMPRPRRGWRGWREATPAVVAPPAPDPEPAVPDVRVTDPLSDDEDTEHDDPTSPIAALDPSRSERASVHPEPARRRELRRVWAAGLFLLAIVLAALVLFASTFITGAST